TLMQQKRWQESYDLASRATEVFRQAGSSFDLIWALHTVGLAAIGLDRLDDASQALKEGMTMLRDSGDMTGLTIMLADVSDLAARRGDAERAVTLRGASA